VTATPSVRERTISLRIPARAEYLIVCRLAISGIASALLLDEGAIDDIKLAVTEACTNAIRHGYGGHEGTIAVDVVCGPDELVVSVEDAGSGFDSGNRRLPGAAGDGGIGLALIEEVVDDLEIGPGRSGCGTKVTFSKLLRSAVAQPSRS
jgi:serine/threonine-protein kinase RsbW